MQTTIDLDDSLIKKALQLTGVKSEQDLIEQAVKDLIKNYQAALPSKKKSWLAGVKSEDNSISPIIDENEFNNKKMAKNKLKILAKKSKIHDVISPSGE